MATRTRLTCVALLVLLASLVATAATASPVDKRTTFTFNTPVAVPGVTLPAGSYLFRLPDPDNAHSVMQVLSADGRTAYAQFFTLETIRSRPAEQPEVRFLETAADMPHAVRSFWYPGETIGYEFMYPREQARLLAKGTGTPVLIAELPVEWTPPVFVEPDVTAEAPPVAVAEAVTPEAAPAAVEPAPVELPATDSPTLTVFLVAFCAIVLALLVRTVRTVTT